MSQAELNRLKRNYETYLKLSPERRQQLADLNAALEQDTKDGGHLQKLLEQYNAWLFKLSPFDRDKLLGTADPGERADLVQKLLREQQKQQSARASRGLSIPYFGARFEAMAPLSPGELDAVLDGGRTQLSQRRDRSIAVGKTSLTARSTSANPPRGHAAIAARTRGGNQNRAERNGPRQHDGRRDSRSRRSRHNCLRRCDRPASPFEIRRQLGQVIGRSILAEWQNEIEESPATTRANRRDDQTLGWLSSSGENAPPSSNGCNPSRDAI